MQDTKTLAQTLGITEKTVRSRAAALGLTPDQVKQGAGRPKAMWSNDQANAIAAYGQSQESAVADVADEETQTAALAYQTAQSALAAPMGQQFAAINQNLEALEDNGAIALANRIAQVPSRTLAKACHLLQSQNEAFDIADVLGGALGLGSLSQKPIGPDYQPRALTQAQRSVYADNF